MDPFIGEIRLVPYTFAPQGWALCDGRLLPINQNQALFSLLGTNFRRRREDERSRFRTCRACMGAGQAASGWRASTSARPAAPEAVGLTVSQLLPAHSPSGARRTAARRRRSTPAGAPCRRPGGSVQGDAERQDGRGDGGPEAAVDAHENRQPYLALR